MRGTSTTSRRSLVLALLLVGGCATTEPVADEGVQEPEPDEEPKATPKPATKPQEHYDKLAAAEFTFGGCSMRARSLRDHKPRAAVKMLYGCMKRDDFRDLSILREKPFSTAIRKDPQALPLVLRVLSIRDEDLEEELRDLRMSLVPAKLLLDGDDSRKKAKFYAVKGRMAGQWKQGSKHMVAVMEREKRSKVSYGRYSYRYSKGRRVQTWVPSKRRSYYYNQPRNNNELIDTGLIVVFKTDKKLKLKRGQTYLFAGSPSRMKVHDERRFELEDQAAMLGDSQTAEFEVEEDADGEVTSSIIVYPETPILELKAHVAR